MRTLLALQVHLALASCQVEYTSAFVHADLSDEVYIEMTQGFWQDGKVLRLKKSLYGLHQSPLNFFRRLKNALLNQGFKQSDSDPCLFISNEVICVCYVDDCLLFAREQKAIDQVISSLQDKTKPDRLLLSVEDDVAGFLGILMTKKEDGTIKLNQTGLIDRIIRTMGLDSANSVRTLADQKPLGANKDGAPCKEQWSYASFVGMMMYLSSNSRPDIAFAVHQCARFMHNPRQSHEVALKRIVRYLKGTCNKGMKLKPSTKLNLDCYADADFAGLWSAELPNDPTCVKSRTGYLLMLGSVPVSWSSKLQSKIALSTTEAEYSALSTAMKELIPLRCLVEKLAKALGVKRSPEEKLSFVYEDNQGALTLANTEMLMTTPRIKHYAIELHWFREHCVQGQIEVTAIDTKVQLADIFTKGLSPQDFESKRRLIVGW